MDYPPSCITTETMHNRNFFSPSVTQQTSFVMRLRAKQRFCSVQDEVLEAIVENKVSGECQNENCITNQ